MNAWNKEVLQAANTNILMDQMVRFLQKAKKEETNKQRSKMEI